ncbi:MAG: hypothetical protein ACFFC7_30220 [Candidatus Hermodarchaeota archaeon]
MNEKDFLFVRFEGRTYCLCFDKFGRVQQSVDKETMSIAQQKMKEHSSFLEKEEGSLVITCS